MSALPPGSTIGIIGGGQLGRMLSLAAATLGYRVHIFSPEPDSCAAEVSAAFTCAAFDDRSALAAFADQIDVATFEFENIDVEPLQEISTRVALWPSLDALTVGQDRIAEKMFATRLGGRTAPWRAVNSQADLDRALTEIGVPAILKTVRFGYDGKGQARILSGADSQPAWHAIGQRPAVVEAVVNFAHEFSIIAARDHRGSIVFWDPTENVHEMGILATSTLPAHDAVVQQVAAARSLTRKVAEELAYIGVFAIEFFVGPEGPVFNEIAPRVHNSGHWTIEGARTSQFENHIRAITGLPLGSTQMSHATIKMQNLIGSRIDDFETIASQPGAHLHLYNKGDARPGRKMGHVTIMVS